MIITFFKIIFTFIFLISLKLFANCNSNQEQPMCGNSESKVSVDVAEQCMCIKNSKETEKSKETFNCFAIAKGYSPLCTTNGTGTLGIAMGAKYSTRLNPNGLPSPGTRRPNDRDAIATGIAENDGPGKWLHKIEDCNGPTYRTNGCLGITCDRWPLVKSQIGEQITVCGGIQEKQKYSCIKKKKRKRTTTSKNGNKYKKGHKEKSAK